MNINQIEKIAQLIVKKFSGQKKGSLFGSASRYLDTDDFFSKPQDLDFLFEVDSEIFEQYCQMCQNEVLNLFGQPHDPHDLFWEYYSPAERRWEILQSIFNIDDSLSKEIVSMLNGRKIDIILLPFEWEKDEEILDAINSRDPKFSLNIQGDKKLLFEK
ncbi:MAG: hypothetical protein PF549_02925 [Patescibacteria group bacterium]|jgi:hypothetical protein|nr:hypothetical protein [Patescibacteria group bacterium]